MNNYATITQLGYILDSFAVTQFSQDGTQDTLQPVRQQFLLDCHANNVESKLSMFNLPIVDSTTGAAPAYLSYIVCVFAACSLVGRKMEDNEYLEKERINCVESLD